MGADRRAMSVPAVTVFLPTKNAGPDLALALDRIRSQRLDRDFELLIIDSGSTDGTAAFLRRQPVRLIEIAPGEFNHGRTRGMAVREAAGDVVVLTVQDALPADEFWLQRLVDCFDDPAVAGAYSRQIPRADAAPFVRSRLKGWLATGTEPRVQEITNHAEFAALPPLERLRRAGFDNVSSAVRTTVARAIPFRDCEFGEDLDWSLRVLLAGHRIVYEPRSAVIHSHNPTLRDEFRRVYLDHRNLRRLFGVRTVPRLDSVARGTAGGAFQLMREIAIDPTLSFGQRLKWWSLAGPHSLAQTLAQYLGARGS